MEETLGGEKVAPVEVERVTVWTVEEVDPEAEADPDADALPEAAELVDVVPEDVVDEDVVELEVLEVEETVEMMVNYAQLVQAR